MHWIAAYRWIYDDGGGNKKEYTFPPLDFHLIICQRTSGSILHHFTEILDLQCQLYMLNKHGMPLPFFQTENHWKPNQYLTNQKMLNCSPLTEKKRAFN